MIPGSSIVAYHHYEGEGLRRIAIRFEEPAEAAPGDETIG
jgi:hypothetical protein